MEVVFLTRRAVSNRSIQTLEAGHTASASIPPGEFRASPMSSEPWYLKLQAKPLASQNSLTIGSSTVFSDPATKAKGRPPPARSHEAMLAARSSRQRMRRMLPTGMLSGLGQGLLEFHRHLLHLLL